MAYFRTLWTNFNPPPPPPPPPPSSRPSSQDSTPPPHSPSPRSSRSVPTDWERDVFVSYRGADVKKTFRQFLVKALDEQGVSCFCDDDPEGRGEKVGDVIFGAIPRSKVALVVLSPRYADSRWCLDELVEILKCKKEHKIHGHGTVLPIFFGVSVGDVKKQEGEFGKGFEQVKRGKAKEKVKDWTNALTKVGALGGLHLKNDCSGDESLLIDKILEWLSTRDIPDRYCNMGRDVVGRDQEADDVISLYSNVTQQNKDACVIGIHGIQGVGKTRLAKLVVSRIYREFKHICFLENVRSETQEGLAEKLIQTVYPRSPISRPLQFDITGKIMSINSRLRQAKVLLVFDDVDHEDKVKIFLEDRRRFPKGSMVLVTARDERLLDKLEVDSRYMLTALSAKGSLQLFSQRVFDADEPADGYKELSENLCHYTGGLPLELEKLGSYIRYNFRSTRKEWEKTLEKLVRNPCIDYVSSDPFRVGPIFKTGLGSFDDKKYTGITQMEITTVGSMIESISIDYDQDGCLVRTGQYGGIRQGKTETIKLDYPREYLTLVSGCTSTDHNPEVIQSLKFWSNVKEYGPYGEEKGRVFVLPKVDNAKITGFCLNSGASLQSIGAYSRTVSDKFPFKKVGPFGGQDGEEWDDGRHTDIRQVNVVLGSEIESISIWYDDCGRPTGESQHGKRARGKIYPVKLDYPYEHLASISGYISTTENSKDIRLSSITLKSNLHEYGPFGSPTGRLFSFPAKCGKIVGFYGRCLGQRLESIGAHYELVSHIYPFRTLGPFGSESGEPWDDGKHSNIRQITIKYGSVINSIICTYDDTDKVMVHGGNGNQYKVISLDYPDEYITAMSGYIAEEAWSVVNSITFQSNRRIWGPFGSEKGRYFSLPLNSGKIVGFYGRTDGCSLNSIGAHFETYSSKQYPFKSVGSFGGEGGERWDDGRFTNIRQIEITVKDSVIRSIKFDYETEERLLYNCSHGPNVKGKVRTITLGQDEYLTSFSGYYDDAGDCIRSLTFQSNKRTCGPYGVKTGKYFSTPSTGGKIIGFHGRKTDSSLISIGAYFKPVSILYPAKRIGPFGGEVGSFWCDENSTAVRQVKVLSDKAGIVRVYGLYEKNGRIFWSSGYSLDASSLWHVDTVTLDYPNEYLTSISGYIKDYADPIIVLSLIFQSNKRIYGPYGKKTREGSYFWYPSTRDKIVSFYGYCSSSHLSSIGVYTEPVSHLYPCHSIGPFGGQQGKRWDDGIFTDVRSIHIEYGSAIVAFSVEYDNNGSPVRCPDHGNDPSYVACSGIAEAMEGGVFRSAKRARPSLEAELKSVSIKLDFPREHLVSISGYTGKVYCEEVVLSLKVETNIRSYYYGNKKGKNNFQLPQEKNCGRIIGFHGTSGRFLNSLGARLEPF